MITRTALHVVPGTARCAQHRDMITYAVPCHLPRYQHNGALVRRSMYRCKIKIAWMSTYSPTHTAGSMNSRIMGGAQRRTH